MEKLSTQHLFEDLAKAKSLSLLDFYIIQSSINVPPCFLYLKLPKNVGGSTQEQLIACIKNKYQVKQVNLGASQNLIYIHC